MSPRLSTALSALALLLSIGCAKTPPASHVQLPAKAPGHYVEGIKIGGFDRSYIFRVPKAYDATKPLPLVVVLHGWTSNAKQAEVYTRMGPKSDKEGFIMVAPDGLGSPQGWNAGFINLTGKQVDDVQFITALLDKVEGEVGVDPDRVFIAGHSNGAFMAHLLASRLSNRLAAVAAVAGTIGVPNSDGTLKRIPDPQGPISVLMIHGKADRMVQYDSKSTALLHDIGAKDSAKWWAEKDGCDTNPIETLSPNGNVITDFYGGGKNGTEVELVSIVNGIHDWPGGYGFQGPETTTGVNAVDLIWDFFKTHPKKHS